MQEKVDMPTESFEASGPADRASLDFLFPQEFETSLDAAVAAMGARFEVRRFFWRERREIAFTPPCSYFEVTRFPSMGRYLASAADFCAQGEVRFYPWARPFQMHWEEREQRSLFCRIDVCALTGLSMELSDRQLRDTIDMRNPHVRALFLRAQQEMMAPGLCSQLILDSISMGLAAEIVQQFGPETRSDFSRGPALDQRYLASLVAHIREQPGKVEIAQLAMERGVSVRHYERLFRAAAGESPAAFCRRHMLALAKDLLMNRSLLVKEIAYRCGFANTASFSVAFRQMEGCSPQQFRDRLLIH
jgi:AraC family transcriptional regulator